MSTFNGNPADNRIKLAYRAVQDGQVYLDPVAQRLATVAMICALAAWLIHGCIIAFRPLDWATLLVTASTCISIVGFVCAVGAMLERNIPWLTWLAVSFLLLYWLMLAWTAIDRVLAPFGTPPPPPFPLS
jgi:hypothetical protein